MEYSCFLSGGLITSVLCCRADVLGKAEVRTKSHFLTLWGGEVEKLCYGNVRSSFIYQ